FFEPLGLRQDRVPGEPDPGPFQKYEYGVLRRVVQAGSIHVFDENPEAKTYLYLLGDERNRAEGKPPLPPGAPAFLGGARLRVEAVQLPALVYYPGLKPFVQQAELALCDQARAAARKALESARQALVRAEQPLAEVEAEIETSRPTPPVVADARTLRRAAVRA